MHDTVKHRLPRIRQLCERYKVKRLELFGSAAREAIDRASSDVDFLVEFQNLASADHSNAYFGLWVELKGLFQKEVDLLETCAIENPYFLAEIKPTRTLLYGA